MRKKILIISNDLEGGGVQKTLISLLQTFDYKKYEIDLLLSSNQGDFFKYIPKEVKVLTKPKYFEWIFISKNKTFKEILKAIGLNLNVFKYIYYLLKGVIIGDMIQRRQELWEKCKNNLNNVEGYYDIAIDYDGQMKGIIVDKVYSKKKITWIHTDYRVYKRKKDIDLDHYRQLDKIIFVSETCKKIFLSEFPDFENKSFIFSNISDKKYIKKLSKMSIINTVDNDDFKILDITRLDPNKGLDKAVFVCKKLVDNGYHVKWYILGEGIERKKIEKLIKTNNLENHFILLGFKENPYPYICNADLIVHCSLFEGKSVAIDEAKLLAKPIILTDYPTARDQITNGENGLICKNSIDSIYDAVISLINDRAMREKFINNLKGSDRSDIEINKELEDILSL